MPSILSVGYMLADVMPKVATLAEVTEVFQIVVGFVVIEVSSREHYHTPCHWVRFIVLCPAIGIRRRAFAAIARPLADSGNDFGEPV